MVSRLFSFEYLKSLIFWIPVILLSISFHEFAHGWMANKLGDPTAKQAGRLTLNPVKHFDILGFLMMLIIHFGWATPVPVNPNYFKKPKQGMLYTALAGPTANMILALIVSLLYSVLNVIYQLNISSISDFSVELLKNSATLFLYLIYINIGLAVFNLIPVYPLDGSRILGFFMPVKYHVFMQKYGQYIQLAFMLLIIFTSFIGNVIGVVQEHLANAFVSMWTRIIVIFIK